MTLDIGILYTATFDVARAKNVFRTSRARLVDDPIGYIAARSEQQPNGCVLWIAGRTVTGYGQAGDGDYAHRVAWVAHHGEVPAGMFVRQSCNNQLCVAKDHLYLTKFRRPPRRK